MEIWNSGRQLRRKLVNAVPQDGCLLVFNANHRDFRKVISEFIPGYLSVHNIGKVLPRGTPYKDEVTDLYIIWK